MDTPSGRFQSRVFSSVSQTALRWRDRLQQTLRQAKLTLTWTTQILLYPIYVMFQSSRWIDRQFQQTVRQSYPRLQAAKAVVQRLTQSNETPTLWKADTPVIHVLQQVQQFALPVAFHPPAMAIAARLTTSKNGELAWVPNEDGEMAIASATSSELQINPRTASSGLMIHGVASDLQTKALVLVTTTNEVLDILNADQQACLLQRISWEVASYLRQQKQLDAASAEPLPFLPPPKSRKNMLPPVRAFRRLMAWVQTSPVAIAANLFQESALVVYAQTRSLIVNPVTQWQTQFHLEPASTPAPGDRWILGWDDWLKDEWVAQWEALTQRQMMKLEPVVDAIAATGASLAATGSTTQAMASSFFPPNSALAFAPVDPADIPYIDAEATLIGYEQHPLEWLLHWLDRGMAWLEGAIARCWTWLRHLLNPSNN